jgi:hypothetical protein
MGWFARLFGGGHPSKPASAPQPTPPSIDRAVIEREMAEARRGDAAMKILWEYAGVLQTVDDVQPDGYNRYLHPESKLPYPKEIIRAAFANIFETMERYQLQQWRGIPKETYLKCARALEEQFAPDEEVPEDFVENVGAFFQRLEKIGSLPPYDHAEWDRRIRADLAGEGHLLKIMGVSQELRDLLINIARAEGTEGERDTTG